MVALRENGLVFFVVAVALDVCGICANFKKNVTISFGAMQKFVCDIINNDASVKEYGRAHMH